VSVKRRKSAALAFGINLWRRQAPGFIFRRFPRCASRGNTTPQIPYGAGQCSRHATDDSGNDLSQVLFKG
jgi:hypothetical protein